MRRSSDLEAALASLGALRQPLSAVELARRLLALDGDVDPQIAQRLVAALLGVASERLPDPREAFEFWRREPEPGSAIPLASAEFAVVDLETTGVSPQGARIIEIGAVRVLRLRCADRFQSLVHPGRSIPSAITTLTGIDDASVAHAPPLALVMRDFSAWLARSPQAPLVAHNASFDAGFLERAFSECGLAPHGRLVLCTRRLARRLLPDLARFNLDTLTAHFGISNRDRHRALGDADATARALVELLHLARADRQVEDLGGLAALQASPTRRRRVAQARAGAPRP